MGPVDGVHLTRTGREAHPRRLPADRGPFPFELLADVDVQVAGEAEDVTHHLVGDHVREQPAHVGQHARVLDQFREQVVFQAGRERLHPPQPAGRGQNPRADLPQEGIGIGRPPNGLSLVGGVDKGGRGCRCPESRKPVGINRRVDDDFHRPPRSRTTRTCSVRPRLTSTTVRESR